MMRSFYTQMDTIISFHLCNSFSYIPTETFRDIYFSSV
jgi:hypothetical protein